MDKWEYCELWLATGSDAHLKFYEKFKGTLPIKSDDIFKK